MDLRYAQVFKYLIQILKVRAYQMQLLLNKGGVELSEGRIVLIDPDQDRRII